MRRGRDDRASWHEGREFEESDEHLPPRNDNMVAPGRWSRVVCGGWVRQEAIHNKEGRAAVLGLRRAAGLKVCRGTRVLSLGDNMSEICAMETAAPGITS